jgi:hypothetical protein
LKNAPTNAPTPKVGLTSIATRRIRETLTMKGEVGGVMVANIGCFLNRLDTLCAVSTWGQTWGREGITQGPGTHGNKVRGMMRGPGIRFQALTAPALKRMPHSRDIFPAIETVCASCLLYRHSVEMCEWERCAFAWQKRGSEQATDGGQETASDEAREWR